MKRTERNEPTDGDLLQVADAYIEGIELLATSPWLKSHEYAQLSNAAKLPGNWAGQIALAEVDALPSRGSVIGKMRDFAPQLIASAPRFGIDPSPLTRYHDGGMQPEHAENARVCVSSLLYVLEGRVGIAPQQNTQEQRDANQLGKLEVALGILAKHPELSDKEIMRRAGAHEKTKYKATWQRYRQARKAMNSTLPKGSKVDGTIEAVDDD
jgi:hypothetical protein